MDHASCSRSSVAERLSLQTSVSCKSNVCTQISKNPGTPGGRPVRRESSRRRPSQGPRGHVAARVAVARPQALPLGRPSPSAVSGLPGPVLGPPAPPAAADGPAAAPGAPAISRTQHHGPAGGGLGERPGGGRRPPCPDLSCGSGLLARPLFCGSVSAVFIFSDYPPIPLSASELANPFISSISVLHFLFSFQNSACFLFFLRERSTVYLLYHPP